VTAELFAAALRAGLDAEDDAALVKLLDTTHIPPAAST
jgi:hypothetical protein